MNDRISGFDQLRVIGVIQAKFRAGQIAAKDADTGFEEFVKAPEIQMQLQGLPESPLSFAPVFGAHQQVEVIRVLFKQERRHMRAHVTGRAG